MTDATALAPATNEVYGLYGTWPRFRFAEKRIGAKWEVVAAVDDAALARGGYAHAGQIRDAADLDPEHLPELVALLRDTATGLSAEEDGRLSALLECGPFTENLPPIDVDPEADATPAEVRAFAARFDAAWRAAGLGTLQWFTTGGRGLHGKLALPPGLRSPHLMRAYGGLVRRVAQTADLPILSYFQAKPGRPPILIDDTLFNRDASGRGSLWALEGAPSRKTGLPKAPAADLPTDPPTFTTELVRRLQQSLDNLGQNAKFGEVRRKPRDRDPSRLPRPLTELQKSELLPRTAEAIVRVLPPEGMRHDFRKALAGWLLREGVPVRVAGSTMAVAGDPVDAVATARTTASRLQTGRNAYGFRKLIDLVGQGGSLALRAALHADLTAHQVPPKELGGLPSDADRMTLREAARLAEADGNATRALTCRRAARCGIAKHRSSCKCCGTTTGCRILASERATCPHCASRRAVSILNWCLTQWPGKLYLVTKKLDDDSLEAARTERRTMMKRLRPGRRRHLRWIIGPGQVAAITADMMCGAVISSWHNTHGYQLPPIGTGQPKLSVAQMLEPILKSRALKLRKHLDAADPRGLADDEWCDKVMEASGGREARRVLPWPKKRDLRLMAVNAARRRQNLEPLAPGVTFPSLSEMAQERSACCNARQNHEVLDAKSSEIVATRDDRPWLFGEASVRAEQGWRGEVLEFSDDGLLEVQILPADWDETKLRE